MIFIGEKINGSVPRVARAIAGRDADYIRTLARAQAEAGAAYIDVCAAVEDAAELDVLEWLIGLVQEVTELPVCVDSPNAGSCVAAMRFCNRPGILNSVSGAGGKCDIIFPAIAGTGWQCIALLCEREIPASAAGRLEVFRRILDKADRYGVPPEKLYIDPMVEMLCTAPSGIGTLLEVMRQLREEQPSVHITGAVSNISFNLPARRLLNQAFVLLAMQAGMDSAILDPTDRDMTGMIYAAEAMLGRDEFCLDYIAAYRSGLFGGRG